MASNAAQEVDDQLRALPPFTDDSVDRLRHTLAAYEGSSDRVLMVTATGGAKSVIGHDWTGLTLGDLRELLHILDTYAAEKQPAQPESRPTEPECRANGRSSFPCDGPVDQWLITMPSGFQGPRRDAELDRFPVCRGHADHEIAWRRALGTAQGRLVPLDRAEWAEWAARQS